MPAPPLSDELALEACAAVRECGGVKTEAAKKLGIPRETLNSRLRTAAIRGLDGRSAEPAPPGYHIRAKSTLYDGEGEKRLEWVKIQQDEADRIEALKQALVETLEPFKGFAVLPPAPERCDIDLATLYPRADIHLGMYAWGEEAGEDWDVDKARKVLGDAAAHLVESAPPSDVGIVLGLGDMFHADDSRNATPKSANPLDVDTRYARVMQVGVWLEIAKVQLALQKHRRVIYKAMAGNHDPHAAIALTLAVGMFFHKEPRVEVDQSPAPVWYYRFGKTLIGATHGHTMKQPDLALRMANDRPQDWAETTCRRFYTGHLHHKRVLEHGGVVCEQFQSPAPRDAYHAAGPWISGRSMCAITFHRERGEVGRTEFAITEAAA